MKKGTKITITILVLAAAAGGGLFFLKKSKGGMSKADENTVYRARQETYENVIEISGTIQAAEEQTLQALSSGTVMAVYVKEGDQVKKGDVILQMDDTNQIYNLEKHDYNIATSKINGSAKEVALMETERLSLLQRIEERKVTATFDGVIAALNVKSGQSLEAKDSVGTLVNVDYLTAEVEIAETDVAKLRVGQEVDFIFSALKNETVKGYVVGWPAIGKVTDRGATIVKTTIRIDEYPAEILPNYSFTGKIVLSAPETYVVVERHAVGFEEDRRQYVVDAKSGEKIYIKARPYGSDYMKVTEGLKGGETLKAVSSPKASGWNRGNNRNGNDRNTGNGNNPGGMPGGMPGPGAGGPR